jgi:hypothetical protein
MSIRFLVSARPHPKGIPEIQVLRNRVLVRIIKVSAEVVIVGCYIRVNLLLHAGNRVVLRLWIQEVITDFTCSSDGENKERVQNFSLEDVTLLAEAD